jgi:nicotinate-nucleotide pyrophosphorylase (carboxylating)
LDKIKFEQLLQQEIKQMCRIALQEDLAELVDNGKNFSSDSCEQNIDVTAELIAPIKNATATLITREAGILCGTAWVDSVFALLTDKQNSAPQTQDYQAVTITWHKKDGDKLEPNDVICNLSGNARDLLTGERSAMNFLQSMSACASLTHQYVEEIKDTQCKLLDTRKTIPGMRFGQKYAVSCGGGTNHRIGLSDAFLIKENHIMSCGSINAALSTAIKNHPDKLLEIEVENLNELTLALDGKAQVIMLDNFTLSDMKKAVAIRDEHVNQAKLEASGNVDLNVIKAIAETGVDFISVGAITKNVEALDLSMRIDI